MKVAKGVGQTGVSEARRGRVVHFDGRRPRSPVNFREEGNGQFILMAGYKASGRRRRAGNWR